MKRIAKAILFRGDKVLLQLRDDNQRIPFPNQWSLFGGCIENNEEPEACLVREIREEIGVTLKNSALILKQHRREGNVDVEDYIFAAELSKDVNELSLNEGRAMQFFALEELEVLDIVQHYRSAIINFLNHRQGSE